ncbi:MAG: S-methyl-5-thioribose-1-phosphate isomerase [Bacteroidales bacterium]|nr:S-methyl-5-thioribose-1-phosphate isomerase [Bacteroidales bacterium]
MIVNGTHYRTVWLEDGSSPCVKIIDQRFLPHRFVVEELFSFNQMVEAVKEMHLRGAGLIGAAAAFGMYLAAHELRLSSNFDSQLHAMAERLMQTRPTAVNLAWAVNRQLSAIREVHSIDQKVEAARETALQIADEDAQNCRSIGLHGVDIIERISKAKRGEVVNVLTHCNAGWLAFVDYGTATAPIYEAHHRGVKIHVWVDETRPRNQGASLTAWELLAEGVPHTLIPDNAGGHLMQHGMVDLVITGADRITSNGDAANKIGTYLKALAAADNGIPFYIAAPSSSFDWSLTDGVGQIPIEQRHPDEVRYVSGLANGRVESVLICPSATPVANYGFDVTPARLIAGIITERGVCTASNESIQFIFPDKF